MLAHKCLDASVRRRSLRQRVLANLEAE